MEEEWSPTSPLVEALRTDDLTRARALLAGGDPLHALLPVDDPWGWVEDASQAAVDELLAARGIEAAAAIGGSTLLHVACDLGRLEPVQALIEAGADLEVQNPWTGWTAVIAATIRGDPPLVAMLVDAGADVDASDDVGDTALHHAARLGNDGVATAIADTLVSAEADPSVRNARGWTPLIEAALGNNTTVLGILIDAGADPNLVDSHRRSALHMAAEANHTRAVELLLVGGANPRLTDEDGATPGMLASRAPATTVSELIEAAEQGRWSDEISGDVPPPPRPPAGPVDRAVAHRSGEVYPAEESDGG